uniref:Maternal protein pumilio n=1 Tax=Cacopsylla melanoneura TaxID=428564 RepID=A0A8D8ZJL1_9HEMI
MYRASILDPYATAGVPPVYYNAPSQELNAMYGLNVLPSPVPAPVVPPLGRPDYARMDSRYLPPVTPRETRLGRISTPPPPDWSRSSPRRENKGDERERHSPSRRNRGGRWSPTAPKNGRGEPLKRTDRSPRGDKRSRSPPRKKLDRDLDRDRDRSGVDRGRGDKILLDRGVERDRSGMDRDRGGVVDKDRGSLNRDRDRGNSNKDRGSLDRNRDRTGLNRPRDQGKTNSLDRARDGLDGVVRGPVANSSGVGGPAQSLDDPSVAADIAELEALAKQPGEVRVRNLPPRTLQREVDALFTWHIGDVTYCEAMENGTKAFVKFRTLELAKKAVDKMYDFNFNEHPLKVTESTADARKRLESLQVKLNGLPGHKAWGNTYGLTINFLESLHIEPPLVPTVYVENMDPIITPWKLSEVFNLAGRVRNVVISYDGQCRSKGEAKVEFEHPVEAIQAISMLNDQVLLDRRLKVTMYHEPPPDKLKFPDGLKGVGLGLGMDGASLRDIPQLLKDAEEKDKAGLKEKERPRDVIDLFSDEEDVAKDSRNRIISQPPPPISAALVNGPLKELEDKVLQMACSREGSAILEEKIATGTEEELTCIFRQVINSIMTVITDMYGVIVIQKLIDLGSTMQRNLLVNLLKTKGPGFKGLAHHKFSYKVVVKMIEVCPLPLQLEVLEELKGHAVFLSKHIHGRHVIDACLSSMGSNYVSFIIQEVTGHVVEMLRDMDGIQVIKKILLQLPQELSGPIFAEILANVPTIITHSCGVKIIYTLLENGHASDTYHVIQALRGVFIFLSQKANCFSILSKLIDLARTEQMDWMLEEICGPDDAGLIVMIKDNNACQILLELLKKGDSIQRTFLFGKINFYLSKMHGLDHGERFYHAVKQFQVAGRH